MENNSSLELLQKGFNTSKIKNQLLFSVYNNDFINPQTVIYRIEGISIPIGLLLEAGVKIKYVQSGLGHLRY